MQNKADQDGNIKTIYIAKKLLSTITPSNGKGWLFQNPYGVGLQECGVQEFNTSSKILLVAG